MLHKLVLILAVSCFAHEESKCIPFPFGTNFFNAAVAAIFGSILPNSCPCEYPCTVEKAQKHVQFFYTTSDLDFYYPLNISDANQTMDIKKSNNLKMFIHGYTDSVKFNGTGWMGVTGQALANATNCTVIMVDYRNISSCSYSRSAEEIVPSIGLYLAELIKRLNLDTDKIELIGHSLGAHIAGIAGAELNGEIARITALDPAGPIFDDTKTGLNKTCAKFVQVLHTDPGDLGTIEERGDLDFYANNETYVQPGCPLKQCGHGKAVYFYFASTFSQYEFFSMQCKQQDAARQASTDSLRFGIFDAGYYMSYDTGNFCFNTTSCFPFALNETDSNASTTTEQ